jgi:hypothetical protein
MTAEEARAANRVWQTRWQLQHPESNRLRQERWRQRHPEQEKAQQALKRWKTKRRAAA